MENTKIYQDKAEGEGGGGGGLDLAWHGMIRSRGVR